MKILEGDLLDGQVSKTFTDKLVVSEDDFKTQEQLSSIEEDFVDDFILRYKNNPYEGCRVAKPFLPDSIRFPIGDFLNGWGHKNDVCCHKGVFFLRTEVYIGRIRHESGKHCFQYTIILETC